jgi:hypothetical protein
MGISKVHKAVLNAGALGVLLGDGVLFQPGKYTGNAERCWDELTARPSAFRV